MTQEINKQAAIDFLQLVVAGRIDEAYQKHVDMRGKHHNAFFPSGFANLKKAMAENEGINPGKRLTVVNALADGDLVAVHSHLKVGKGEPDMTVVHLFRFADSKIIEMWDCGQRLPADSPNSDGAF